MHADKLYKIQNKFKLNYLFYSFIRSFMPTFVLDLNHKKTRKDEQENGADLLCWSVRSSALISPTQLHKNTLLLHSPPYLYSSCFSPLNGEQRSTWSMRSLFFLLFFAFFIAWLISSFTVIINFILYIPGNYTPVTVTLNNSYNICNVLTMI